MIADEPLRGTDKKNEYCLPLLQEPLIHFHVPDTVLLSLPLSGAPFFTQLYGFNPIHCRLFSLFLW